MTAQTHVDGDVVDDFVVAGVLDDGDARLGRRLAWLGGDDDPDAALAVALLLRAVRQGSVLLDLDAVPTELLVTDEDGTAADLAGLPWPDRWAERIAGSSLVRQVLRTDGQRIWLARHWQQERHVALELRARALADRGADHDDAVLEAALARLFPREADADQLAAARTCVGAGIAVLAGGPGTGKTTTVARLLALLREQDAGHRIALAAPTGKAATRLAEAVNHASELLPEPDRRRARTVDAQTLHRLLGGRPGGGFRRDRHDRLAVDTVVVDEASMVPLSMMSALLEALRPHTRLVLVGDPDQLASVDAGAVLADVVDAGPGSGIQVATLRVNHRFDDDSGIALLARAVRDGDVDAALATLDGRHADVELVPLDDDELASPTRLRDLHGDVVDTARERVDSARDGRVADALEALDAHRLLCAHRGGARGVSTWNDLAATWADPQHALRHGDELRIGDPLLVTANDYDAGLFNGDSGVVVETDGRVVAAFGRGARPVELALSRLGAVVPLHAMTVHRSQGSQFDRVSVVLPPAGSALATRQTLYTAVTRARSHLRLIGTAEAVRRAVDTPAARATGLAERLSEPGEPDLTHPL